jgi:drug/metabolite transporter (DMT)-like permease
VSLGVLESTCLAALAGTSIGLIGVTYRLGQPRGLLPLDILAACCVLGTAVFGAAFWTSGGHVSAMPASLWAWGVAAGLGQYAAIKLFGSALRFGPLAPAWCVVSLNFVPTMVYAAMFLAEELLPLQYAAVAASALCVVVASIKPEAGGTARAAWPTNPLARQSLYLAILAGIFLACSLLSISIRAVGEQKATLGEPLSRQYGHFLLLQCYVVMMVCGLLDTTLSGRLRTAPKALAALGLLAGIGSVCGLALLQLCSSSTMAFPVASIAQIVVVAVISVLAFREKPTATWYGTIALGLLAVVLANWQQIQQQWVVVGG